VNVPIFVPLEAYNSLGETEEIMHPVVEIFMRKRPLADLRQAKKPIDAITSAVLSIHDVLWEKLPLSKALHDAEAVSADTADPAAFLIFLIYWSRLSFRKRRTGELLALTHQLGSLVSEKSPAEIRSAVLHTEADAAVIESNFTLYEEKLKESAAVLPVDSLHREDPLFKLGFFLARQGRAVEIEEALDRLATLQGQTNKAATLRFVNAVETGQINTAVSLAHQLEDAFSRTHETFPFLALIYERYSILLSLIRSQALSSDSVRVTLASSERRKQLASEEDLEAGKMVVQSLLQRRMGEALRWAREGARGDEAFPLWGTGFYSFNMIRAELSMRHGDAAQRIIEKRQALGLKHYLDDLFLARVDLLEGRGETAARRFVSALKAASYYHAEGRIDLELKLAGESELGDFAKMFLIALKTEGAYEFRPPKTEKEEPNGLARIIGPSAALSTIRTMILRFAPLRVPVLITGETGTGKELVAQALHEIAPWYDRPFVVINCATISESLLESELFGHSSGAFTGATKAHKGVFEEAGEGTIFLDEIGEISPRLQVALLRVIEKGEIRPLGSSRPRKIACRIVAATNADLQDLTKDGRFRKDLLFRLQRLEVHIPCLRERPDDIISLANHFLAEGRGHDMRASMSDNLRQAILQHDWPGNVRELRSVIERMRLMNSDKLSYTLTDLDIRSQGLQAGAAADPSGKAFQLDYSVIEPNPVSHEIPEKAGNSELGQGVKGDAQTSTHKNEDIGKLLREGTSSMRRLDRLKELFQTHHKLTRGEIARIFGVSPRTVTRDLKILCKEGYIEKVEPKKAPRTHYFSFLRPT